MDQDAWIAICERLARVETMIQELVRWREWMVLFWITTIAGLAGTFIQLLFMNRRLKNNKGK